MKASDVQSWPIDKIKPYDKNFKLHNPHQVSKIAKSIQEFGFDVPIVVDKDGVIIKGHGRRMAAIELGMESVPVIVREDLTADQVRLARIADNKVAEGEMDEELMLKEFGELSDAGADLTLTAFGKDELKELGFDLDAAMSSPEEALGADALGTAPHEIKADSYTPKFQVVIELENEAAQQAIYEKLVADGHKCRVLSL